MAKPGTHGDADRAKLAAMAAQARDLGGGELPEAMLGKLRAQAEGQLGLRCGGCGKRIGVGLQFTRIDFVMKDGTPQVDVLKLAACNGADGCEYAAECREGADLIEMVEYVWLAGEPAVGSGASAEEAVAQAEAAVAPPPE